MKKTNTEDTIIETDIEAVESEKEPKLAKKLPKLLLPIVTGTALIILLSGVGYKAWEAKTLVELEKMHNNYVTQELETIQEAIKFGHNISKEYRDEYEKNGMTMGGRSADEYVEFQKDIFDRYEKNINTYEDREKDAIAKLETHKSAYETYVTKRLTPFSSTATKQAKELIDHKKTFYGKEIEDINRSMTANKYVLSLYELRKDSWILNNFMTKMSNMSESQIASNFNSLSPLEKYTRSDYKIRDEEQVKKLFPYVYESIGKQVKLLKSSYLAIKDVASGDLASAAYKFARLKQDTAEVSSIDDERINKDGQDETIAIDQVLSDSLLKEMKVIKDLRQTKSLFSFLPKTGDWAKDAVACYPYLYKIDQYANNNDKYPSLGSFDELKKELQDITPELKEVDGEFDAANMTYSTTEKEVTFTCKVQDKEYSFTYFKPFKQQEDEKKK